MPFDTSRVGLVAGDKNLPLSVCEFAKKNKIPFSVVGIKGSVNFKVKNFVDVKNYESFFISELSKTIAFFKEQNVKRVVIVGGVNTAKFKFTFDLLRLFFKLLFMKNKYDGILRLVISEFEKAGFEVVGIQNLMPELLIKKGVLGDVFPNENNMSDILSGLPQAVKFALTDKGQSVIVKDKKIIAQENFSGTDNLIFRASKIKNSKGAVLIKVVKPQQELRADIPVLGVDTIKALFRAGFDGIAVQSDGAIIENRDEVIKFANKLGIFILGV